MLWTGWIVGVVMSIGAAEPVASRPNIVLILADDVGWSDLACYGADLHETPCLDRLAAEGARFTQAYAASVCSPTRSSLLTGKHCARLGITIWLEASQSPPRDRKLIPPVTKDHLPHEEVTLAERLKELGYLTLHVGKWHLGNGPYYPETQGFDVNIGGTFWGAPATHFFPYLGKTRSGELRYVPGLGIGKAGDELTERMTDIALRLIDEAGDRPFFLNLWYHNAHTPIEAKKELVAKYQQKLRPGMNHQNPTYAAMIETLDANIGRVLQKLEERGIAERTIVLFLSDNGGYISEYDGRRVTSNAPLRSGKGSLYEGGIRVPWIMRGPNIAEGKECSAPVVVMDLVPTLLCMAAIDRNGTHSGEVLEGQDLSSLLRMPEMETEPRTLYFHYPHYYPSTTPVSAVRKGDWKLLHYYEDDRVELYNVRQDMGERNNLASEEPETAKDLRGTLDRWLVDVRASLPVNNSQPTSDEKE